MANNSLETHQSFIPTGKEIVLYNHQEANNWRECPNNVIVAEPISSWKPKEASGAVEGDGSTRKRKRTELLEMENDKEFSLLELYKSNNIHEIISRRQKDETTTIDPQELIKYLKGWTVETRKRAENNGRDRVDRTYRHPKCKRVLRSLVEVRKFIDESSHTGKASDNVEEGSQDTPSKMYLQIFKRLEKTYGNGAQQTFSNSSTKGSSFWSEQHEAIGAPKTAWGATFKSHDTVDSSIRSHRPFHYQERMNEKRNVVQQAAQISDSSKQQVFSNLTRPSGQESVRTFGVGLPLCDVFGGSSSSTNITSLDEIKMMVQSQVEAQIEARVAAQVAEKISHFENAQREMAQKMESMHRLLMLQGMLPQSQFPNTRRS